MAMTTLIIQHIIGTGGEILVCGFLVIGGDEVLQALVCRLILRPRVEENFFANVNANS